MSVLYSLNDTYAKERIDDLLKIGAAEKIHDTNRALGQRAADLYAQNAAGQTYNSSYWLKSFKTKFITGYFGS